METLALILWPLMALSLPGYLAGRLKKTKILIGLCTLTAVLLGLLAYIVASFAFFMDYSRDADFKIRMITLAYGLLGAAFCYAGGFIGRKVAGK